jgi:hypothetical protein
VYLGVINVARSAFESSSHCVTPFVISPSPRRPGVSR